MEVGETQVGIQTCNSLSETRIADELRRECWENANCKIRPLRPFSNGVGVKQPSSVEDVAFRSYALENDVLMQFVQQNPKRKIMKGKMCHSW